MALKNYFFKRPITPLDKSSLSMRVLPTDCDLNFHMNNGRYLTIMDIGRFDLIMRLGMLSEIINQKLTPIVAGANITFFKSLNPFEKYYLESQLLCWDDSWFYIQQQFVKQNGVLAANALVKVTFLKNGKRLTPSDILKSINHDVAPPVMPEFIKAFLTGDDAFVKSVKR